MPRPQPETPRSVPAALRERQRKGVPSPNRGKRFPVEVLTEREVQRLIAACPPTRTGTRNRALIALLYRSGLRSAECLALVPKDLDLERGAIAVLRGKGSKRRTVGVDPQTAELVEAWLIVRAGVLRPDGQALDEGDPLFVTLAGRQLSGSSVRETLPRTAKRAGIRKRVHQHGFRHTHAYELTLESVPLPIIQRQLGHERLSTTEIYVNHFAAPQVIRTMRDRRWSPDGH